MGENMDKNYFCKYNWRTMVENCVKQIDTMKKFYEKWEEPEVYDDLFHCSELGHKLLKYDYFKDSDEGSSQVDELLKEGKLKEAIKLDCKFGKTYKKEYNSFVKDLGKFFILISESAKEWL